MRIDNEALFKVSGLELGDRLLFSFYSSPVTLMKDEEEGYHFIADNGKFFYFTIIAMYEYDYYKDPAPYGMTAEEKAIIANLDNRYHWMTRDDDFGQSLRVWERKPQLYWNEEDDELYRHWESPLHEPSVHFPFDKVFKFVKASDKTPFCIDDLRRAIKEEQQ